MREPDFMIVGAARAGTTTLYHYLNAHPEIFMAKPLRPESKFFLDPQEFKKGKAYLLETRYQGAGDQKAVGEKSTHYMCGSGVAERLHAIFPRLRLIFILRDPVERAVSNYWWSVKNGFDTLPLEDALDWNKESERIKQYNNYFKLIQPFSYIIRGFYFKYIQDYLRFFPRENILILITEELEHDTLKALNQVLAFLRASSLSNIRLLKTNEVPRLHDVSQKTIGNLIGIFRKANEDLERYLGREITVWRK